MGSATPSTPGNTTGQRLDRDTTLESRFRYDSKIPPAPVTKNLRERLDAIAKDNNTSLCQTIRVALRYFADHHAEIIESLKRGV